jgi:hypothetical protein
MRIARCLLAVSLAAAPLAAAAGEIYRWTDENGKLHFTQDPERIPPRYRYQSQSPSGNLNVVPDSAETPRRTAPSTWRAPASPDPEPPRRLAPPVKPRDRQAERAKPLKTNQKYEYGYDCNGSGRCRRRQTEEFKQWKRDEAARKEADAAADAERDDWDRPDEWDQPADWEQEDEGR